MKKYILMFVTGFVLAAGLSGAYIQFDRKWQAEQLQIEQQKQQLKKEKEKHEELLGLLEIERKSVLIK